jgi:hypothetical protein
MTHCSYLMGRLTSSDSQEAGLVSGAKAQWQQIVSFIMREPPDSSMDNPDMVKKRH